MVSDVPMIIMLTQYLYNYHQGIWTWIGNV